SHTLSLHDALPIWYRPTTSPTTPTFQLPKTAYLLPPRLPGPPPVRWEETRNGSGPNHQKATAHYRIGADCDRRRHRFGCLYARRNRHRSEEHTSELQSRFDIVC